MCFNKGDSLLSGIFFIGDTNLPWRNKACVKISSLTKGGTLDRVTFLAGKESGRTETNSPLITIPCSTKSLALSTLSKKITIALFILEADNTPECPTTSPIAKQQSSTLTTAVTLIAWRLVSEHKPCARWTDMLPKNG